MKHEILELVDLLNSAVMSDHLDANADELVDDITQYLYRVANESPETHNYLVDVKNSLKACGYNHSDES